MQLTIEQIRECQGLLGITPQQIQESLRGAHSQTEAEARLKELKDRARKTFRQLSKELHPDVTPDPDKHEKFKRLALVIEDFESLNVTYRTQPPPPPRPAHRVVFVQFVSYGAGTATNTSTTSSTAYACPGPPFYTRWV
jgi:hypothetical protein